MDTRFAASDPEAEDEEVRLTLAGTGSDRPADPDDSANIAEVTVDDREEPGFPDRANSSLGGEGE